MLTLRMIPSVLRGITRAFLWIVSLSLFTLIGGCTITYNAVATYNGIDEILSGTVISNSFEGGGSFQLEAKKSGIIYEGIAERPYYIPSSSDCKGQRGRGFGKCSDGRQINFEWIAHSCDLIYGEGEDTLGNAFQFVDGINKKEEAESIKLIQSGRSVRDVKDYIAQEREWVIQKRN